MPAPIDCQPQDNGGQGNQTTNQMWPILKLHVLRERARKKQEREQELVEERLRKERVAKEQQDVMTLGETREQLVQLEAKLTSLKEEKHQLFLQLKKVLNEDDNRRRHQAKENEMNLAALQSIPMHPQLYIGPVQSRMPNLATPPPTQQYQTSLKSVKRQRSPSPPNTSLQQAVLPIGLYHQQQQQGGFVYGGGGSKGSLATGQYQQSPQKDDNRRTNDLVRAVLWNKPQQQQQQYSQQQQQQSGSAFYPVQQQQQQQSEISIYYSIPPPPPPNQSPGQPRYITSQQQHNLNLHHHMSSTNPNVNVSSNAGSVKHGIGGGGYATLRNHPQQYTTGAPSMVYSTMANVATPPTSGNVTSNVRHLYTNRD